eukprot:GHVR01143969.1.p1 GENE.GHVR01143969.1~~GHVR01143969.1.p1  ORF type:complete len:206 (+),score=38.29 GHVR01143969.1:252-869(+)
MYIENRGYNVCVDLGCGEAFILQHVRNSSQFSKIVGVDVEAHPNWYEFTEFVYARERGMEVEFFTIDLYTPHPSLLDSDLLICTEVVEHLDDVDMFIEILLNVYQPKRCILTTPNREYNIILGLIDSFRHSDHRFEWNRKEFESFCEGAASRGYSVSFDGVGGPHPHHGYATQIALFDRLKQFKTPPLDSLNVDSTPYFRAVYHA